MFWACLPGQFPSNLSEHNYWDFFAVVAAFKQNAALVLEDKLFDAALGLVVDPALEGGAFSHFLKTAIRFGSPLLGGFFERIGDRLWGFTAIPHLAKWLIRGVMTWSRLPGTDCPPALAAFRNLMYNDPSKILRNSGGRQFSLRGFGYLSIDCANMALGLCLSYGGCRVRLPNLDTFLLDWLCRHPRIRPDPILGRLLFQALCVGDCLSYYVSFILDKMPNRLALPLEKLVDYVESRVPSDDAQSVVRGVNMKYFMQGGFAYLNTEGGEEREAVDLSKIRKQRSFVAKLLERPNRSRLLVLREIASSFPFLFIDRVEALFETVNEAMKDGLGKLGIAALRLLNTVLLSPGALDAFFIWFFTHYESFTEWQLLGNVIVLEVSYSTPVVQQVMTAMFLDDRYDFPALLQWAAAMNNPLLISHVCRIATIFFGHGFNEQKWLFSDIQCMDSPFNSVFPGAMIISSPTNLRQGKVSDDILETLRQDRLSASMVDPQLGPTKPGSWLRPLLRSSPKPNNIEQLRVAVNALKPVKPIPEMERVAVKYPWWAARYHHEAFRLLHAEHAKVVLQMLIEFTTTDYDRDIQEIEAMRQNCDDVLEKVLIPMQVMCPSVLTFWGVVAGGPRVVRLLCGHLEKFPRHARILLPVIIDSVQRHRTEKFFTDAVLTRLNTIIPRDVEVLLVMASLLMLVGRNQDLLVEILNKVLAIQDADCESHLVAATMLCQIERTGALDGKRLLHFAESFVTRKFENVEDLVMLGTVMCNIGPNLPPAGTVLQQAAKILREWPDTDVLRSFLQSPALSPFEDRYAALQRDLYRPRAEVVILPVRRSHELEDARAALLTCRGLMSREIRVEYEGESGFDHGGLRREFFTQLVGQIRHDFFSHDPGSDTWSVCPSQLPNREMFAFIGEVLAKVFASPTLAVDLPLSRRILLALLERPMPGNGVELEHGDSLRSLNSIAECSEDQLLEYNFEGPRGEKIIEYGNRVPVTMQNRAAFIDLRKLFYDSYGTAEIAALCTGFHSIVPARSLRWLTPDEISLKICGKRVDHMLAYCESTCKVDPPGRREDALVKMFWKVVNRFDTQWLIKFLQFVSGLARVPDGFQITLWLAGDDPNALPVARTCSTTLQLPPYPDADTLDSKLRMAIEESPRFTFL
jgi:predicted membrane protein